MSFSFDQRMRMPRKSLEFHPFAGSMRRKFRRRATSAHDGYCRLLKGRCFMEPLLPRKNSTEERRRSRRTSATKTVDPALAFGEIGFLKNKLGFTLPSAEDTVKRLSLAHQPKGRLFTLSDASNRFSAGLEKAGLIYAATFRPRSRSRLQTPGKKRGAFPRTYSAPVYPVHPLQCFRTSDVMLRNRSRQVSQIDLLLRNLEPAMQTVKKRKERAILPLNDGSVVVYTKEELDSFFEMDEEMLQAVKRKIATDRRKVAVQCQRRRDNSISRSSYRLSLASSSCPSLSDVKRKTSLRISHMFNL